MTINQHTHTADAPRPYLDGVDESGGEQQEAQGRHATERTHTQTHTEPICTESSDKGVGQGDGRGWSHDGRVRGWGEREWGEQE